MYYVLVIDDKINVLEGLCRVVKAKYNRQFMVCKLDAQQTDQGPFDDVLSSKAEALAKLREFDGEMFVMCVPFSLPLTNAPTGVQEYKKWLNVQIEHFDVWKDLVKPITSEFNFDLLVVDADLHDSDDECIYWKSGFLLAEKMRYEHLNFPWESSRYIVWTGQSSAIENDEIENQGPYHRKIIKSGGRNNGEGSALVVELVTSMLTDTNLAEACAILFNTGYGENVGHGLSRFLIEIDDYANFNKTIRMQSDNCAILMKELGWRTLQKQCLLVRDKFVPNLPKLERMVRQNKIPINGYKKLCHEFWQGIVKNSCDWTDPLADAPEPTKSFIAKHTEKSNLLKNGIETFAQWRHCFFKMRFWPNQPNSWLMALYELLTLTIDQKTNNNAGNLLTFVAPRKGCKLEVFLPKRWMVELFAYLSGGEQFLQKLYSSKVAEHVWLGADRIDLQRTIDVTAQPYQVVLKISSTQVFHPNGNQMPNSLGFLCVRAHLKHIYRLYVAIRESASVALYEVVAAGEGHEIVAVDDTIGLNASDILMSTDAQSGFALVFNSYDRID